METEPILRSLRPIRLRELSTKSPAYDFCPSDFAASLNLSVDATSLEGCLPITRLGRTMMQSIARDKWQRFASLAGCLWCWTRFGSKPGAPQVLISDPSDNKKVVRFDGFSQLFSSFDFGSLLGEYSILGARHTGGQNGAVISSVGSDWIFGLGNEKSAY